MSQEVLHPKGRKARPAVARAAAAAAARAAQDAGVEVLEPAEAVVQRLQAGGAATEADVVCLQRAATKADARVAALQTHLDEASASALSLHASLREAEAQIEAAVAAAAAAAAAKLRGLSAASLDASANEPPVVVGLSYVTRCTGDFAAERIIGDGGFGTVYRAVDAALGVRFAVKRLKAAGEQSAAREIEVLSRFRHINIIRLLGYTARDDTAPRCVLYELAERGGLDAHLAATDGREVALGWLLRLRCAAGLARALAFLHRSQAGAPAFHRDVKAANVALTADWTPKLIDAGLAKLFRPRPSYQRCRWGSP